jgi:sugar/nucleoside kinase (ribokinase family)
VDVLCVGHAAWDVTLPLDEFPAEDDKVEIAASVESGGGPAANAAWLLSSWGVACGFAGVIGEDDFGRRVLGEFAAIGTDVSDVEVRAAYPTPLSIILVNRRTGSRTVVNRRTPGTPLTLRYEHESAPRVLLFDGHEPDASWAAMDRFPAAPTVLDAGSLRPGTVDLARRVEFVVASERFARQLAGLPPLDAPNDRAAAIAAVSALNGRPTVVTLGGRGLIHGMDETCEHLPAIPVEAVDTTAAGDAFHGAFAYAVLTGMAWGESLQFASMTAALSVQAVGGRRSFPSLAIVRRAMAGGTGDES